MFIWGELVRLDGLAQLDEMIFIPCSYGTFYLTSIKKFVMSLEKDHIIFKRDCFYFQGGSLQKGITCKGLFTWEKLSRLGGETIPTRSRHNADFHQQKISVRMSWKFARLTEISPTPLISPTTLYRSSHQRCSIEIDVLRNFRQFTGKHLCQSLLFNKVAGLT